MNLIAEWYTMSKIASRATNTRRSRRNNNECALTTHRIHQRPSSTIRVYTSECALMYFANIASEQYQQRPVTPWLIQSREFLMTISLMEKTVLLFGKFRTLKRKIRLSRLMMLSHIVRLLFACWVRICYCFLFHSLPVEVFRRRQLRLNENKN